MKLLTKSKYKIGLQCPKYLWMMVHDLDKVPPLSVASLYVIDQGNQVGQLAKQLFKDAIDLQEEDFKLNLEQTREAITKGKTIFEAGILTNNLYARADVLKPNKDKWDIIEVKASNKVKEDHLHDVSFQKYVYELAGLKINKCYVLHLNKEFKKQGEIQIKKLLTKEDITQEVEDISKDIKLRIDAMLNIINSNTPPETKLGNGCTKGTKCDSVECWDFLPESNVFELYYGGKKSLELLEAEVLAIKDIPDEFKLTEKQDIQRQCAISGKSYVKPKQIKKFLDKLEYPVYYMDFETFSTAIPLYDGLGTYHALPFQFCVVKDDGNTQEVREFLHTTKEDPRRYFLDALKQALDSKGTIVAFNKSFEIARLKDLAKHFPKEQAWVDSVIKRIIDLAEPFKAFSYYNPEQKGSCSLKSVMPAILGKDHYKDLDIYEGELASVSYFELVHKGVGDAKKVREDLLKYCRLDTEGMMWIVRELEKF